jgi:L,D-transpeptidase catalytic domain
MPPMPHSIFFSQKGHAIHGYLNTRNIGSPASHGCVRLEPDNAARLYALVEEQGLPNTKVVITGDVRVALGQRGLPRDREADTTVATREPFGVRSQAHQPPYYDHQSPAGYPAPSGYPALSYDRVAPAYPYDAPRLPADGSYRSYPYRY